MKYIIILGDGMADEPVEELGGLTPLEVASTPVMDRLAREGRVGRFVTVPEGFHPGSEVANMTVLGYDVNKAFEGRGVLEAASMGVDVPEGTMALRCNLITVADGRIKNHSGGHISTEEAAELMAGLQKELGDDRVTFYPGVSYRHLLLIKGGNKRVACTPPHDVPGTPYRDVLPVAEVAEAEATASLLNDLIGRSQRYLATHPVNIRRVEQGKEPANSIWPWSPGYRPDMRPVSERYPIKNGVVISAVDLISGIGAYAGLRRVNVEGATGLYDTNYEGKAEAAVKALRDGADFVFLHVEASDEAGHEGDVALKVKTIEYLDSRVLAPVTEAAATLGEPLAVAVLPDHPTPCRLRTHTCDPVPFLIMKPGMTPDKVTSFSEKSAVGGSYGVVSGDEFMNLLINTNTI